MKPNVLTLNCTQEISRNSKHGMNPNANNVHIRQEKFNWAKDLWRQEWLRYKSEQVIFWHSLREAQEYRELKLKRRNGKRKRSDNVGTA